MYAYDIPVANTIWLKEIRSRTCLYMRSVHVLASYLFINLFLQVSQQLGRRLLTISLRVVPGPEPEILASLLECMLGLPAEFGVGAGRVRSEVEDIASATRSNLVSELAADGGREGIDHLVDGAALAGTQVPGTHTGVVSAQVVEGFQVALGQVEDVDVVADSGSVAGVVV